MRAYAVFHLTGWILSALAVSMLLPAIFAYAKDSIFFVRAFLAPAFIVGFIGGALILAFRDRSEFTGRWESLLLLGLVWVLVPVAGALPFYTADFPKGLTASLFEATSGFTTTGATTITDLANTPLSIIVWRAMLQWLGGLTTLLALAAILGPLSGSFMLDRHLRVIGRSTHGSVTHMVEALRFIAPYYTAITAACFTGLVLTGIPAFDAFCLALSTVSTGGFMPREGTIALYGLPLAELCLAVFMFTGAVSVVWLRAILQARWTLVRETREPYWIMMLIVVCGIGLSVMQLAGRAEIGWLSTFDSLVHGLATAASIISTTGFQISSRTQELIPFLVLLGLCVMGGGRFSTAGGVKIYRVAAMLRQIGRELLILIYPHGVKSARYGQEADDSELIRAIWITLAGFILLLSAVSLTLAATGLGFSEALLASAAAISNIGPAYDIARPHSFPDAPSYAGMNSIAQMALCVGMILGRVEILALLTFFNLANWRD